MVKSLIVDVMQLPVTFAIARQVLSGEGISKTFDFEQSIKMTQRHVAVHVILIDCLKSKVFEIPSPERTGLAIAKVTGNCITSTIRLFTTMYPICNMLSILRPNM